MPAVVAVTGATGFIGRHLVDSLLKKDVKIKALTRKPRPVIQGVEWILGDLSDSNALKELVNQADSVIHCAGQVRGSCYADFEKANVTGTEILLREVINCNPTPRFLMVSSLAAREPQLSWYAKSKHQGEKALIRHGETIRWTILRPTAVYGPGDKELSPLFRMTRAGILPIIGPSYSKVGLLYVEDLIAAIICWMNTDKTDGNIYELDDGSVGGYDRYKIKDVAGKVWGRRIIIISVPVFLVKAIASFNLLLARILKYLPMLTPGKVRELCHHDWVCNNRHYTDATGWTPITELKDGLVKAVATE